MTGGRVRGVHAPRGRWSAMVGPPAEPPQLSRFKNQSITTRLRPSSLAWYIALSAAATSSRYVR